MGGVLVRIKRAVLAGRYDVTAKAADEMDAGDLTRLDVAEAILNADRVHKTIRSTSPLRLHRREHLHVVVGRNLVGRLIYTKGKLVVRENGDDYYVLVSAKLSE
jgi:hypothetical protein